MDTLNPNSNPNSPNKRLRTETLTLDSSIPSSIDEEKAPIIADDNNCNIPSSIDKGKAPIIADDNESDDGFEFPAKTLPESCGICLIEEGKTVRGLIDSCDHYYCFLCIIEWSKIESRCPLCRGRFSSIRRVRKDGSFIGDSCVRVPVRDQLYDPFGEPADPYLQAKCSVCNGTSDEWLLLLCDLCDSASHTYCVGLGATVPEGDWYCPDCTLLRAEQLDCEMGDNVVASPCVDEPSSTSASVSIFDIVRDPSESKEPASGTNRLRRLVSQHPTRFSSSAIASDQPSVASARTVTGGRGSSHYSADVSESSARTLKNCRDVQQHINILRENWDAVRAGSLSFPAALGKFNKKRSLAPATARKSCKIQSSSSTSSLQSKALHNLGDATHNNKSYNVDRAWKLMSIAKTKEQKSKSACKVAQNKALSIKKNKPVPKRSESVRNDLISPKLGKQIPSDKVSERSAQSFGEHSFTSSSASVSGCKFQKSCVISLSMPREIKSAGSYDNRACIASSKMLKGVFSTVSDHDSPCLASSLGSTAVASGVSCSGSQREISVHPVEQVGYLNISTFSKMDMQHSFRADKHNESDFPSEYFGRQNSSMFYEHDSFACSTSSYEPVSYGSDASHVKLEGKKISSCPGKVGTNTISKNCKDDEAKGEIQSLVKLNLKLLSKNKRLGVDDFKEVARRSTHTILASCGFEHRNIARCLPTLVCHHSDQTQPFRRSTIVPKSCRECFYAFVKDVVRTIMCEKLSNAGVAS